MSSFKVGDIEVTLQRKRIKNMHLRIKSPSGEVVVSAPKLMPERYIRQFVESKYDWIVEHRKKAMTRFESVDGNDREYLKSEIERLLPVWEKKTGLYSTSWHIRDMTSRWGSCNTQTGRLCFNLQLAKKSTECIEYVILHELAHLKVPNHGSEFKAILDAYMPNWREIRKKMNG